MDSGPLAPAAGPSRPRRTRRRRTALAACLCLCFVSTVEAGPSSLAATRDRSRAAATVFGIAAAPAVPATTTSRAAALASKVDGLASSASLAASLTSSATAAPTSTSQPPFPQPFDSPLGSNFTSLSCPTFLQAAMDMPAIAACKPVSLLLTSSTAFFKAERNASVLVPPILAQACSSVPADCTAKMDAIATALQDRANCGDDLAFGQPSVQIAFDGLKNYAVQREATCLTDVTSSNYCFVNATSAPTSTTASYLFFLPSGSSIPSGTAASCDDCSRALMGVYARYATNTSLTLSKTYPAAQVVLDKACGSSFAPVVSAIPGSAACTLTSRLALLLTLVTLGYLGL